MISKETIIDFFENLSQGNEFDTSDKLLWSYFFLDKNIKNLKNFSLELEKLGFKFNNIFQAEKLNENEITEYYLQVERIEHHDVESLYKLNEELYNLSNKNSIDFYDGFDAGNILSSENIK